MDDRYRRWERRFEWPVFAAALLVLPVIVIEETDVGDALKDAAAWLNWAIWIVFAAEFLTLLALTSDRRTWIRTHLLEAFIVVATPPFLPASMQAARLFRLLRVLRLLRLFQMTRRLFTVHGLKYAATIAGFVALGGGAAFAAAESRSTWDGVYWAVTTMTTVGYGDVPVTTDGGRAIALVVMLVGIGFLSLLIGAAAERFVAQDVSALVESEDELAAANVDIFRELQEIRRRLDRVELAARKPG
jgi:voltage-gated potassium channel